MESSRRRTAGVLAERSDAPCDRKRRLGTGDHADTTGTRIVFGLTLTAAAIVPCLLLFIASCRAEGAAEAVNEGFAGLTASIQRLPVVAGALHVVAHPDDENAGILVYLTRKDHARTALLTATRGEGGQNLIGPERGEAMGVLRTGELLAADRYYGVNQYFTRAYDFGYSKTAEETLAKWGREKILGDFVGVIRTVRPDIIISRFQGTPADGHGHHQAVGILIREAFRAAGDPNRFPEQIAAGLRPWTPMRLYQEERERIEYETMDLPRVFIAPQYYSPVLGFTDLGWGMMGINQHRSQGMAARMLGSDEKARRFVLVEGESPSNKRSTSLFDGIDVSIPGILDRVPAAGGAIPGIEGDLGTIAELAKVAGERLSYRSPYLPLWSVLDGLQRIESLIGKVPSTDLTPDDREELLFLLRWKERDFRDAARRLAAVEVEAVADDDSVVPGQDFGVTVRVHNEGGQGVEIISVRVDAPAEWQVERGTGNPGTVEGGRSTASDFTVSVPEGAPVSRLPFYRAEGTDSSYRLRNTNAPYAPFPPPIVAARVRLRVLGIELDLDEPVRAAVKDPATGIEWREVQVVPGISVRVDPEVGIVPADQSPGPREWRVVLANEFPGASAGTATVSAPEGWTVEPNSFPFQFSREGETAVTRVQVNVPADTGGREATIRAWATAKGREYALTEQVVSYPNTGTHRLYRPSESLVRVADVAVSPDLSVGYIRGTQDRIPEALRQLPIELTLLGEKDLAFGNLDDYDCIVSGPRAYAERQDLREYNQRLLDYAGRGGVYIVQYNKDTDWNPTQFAPYPASYKGNDRVTVETAPVEILVPGSPVFNSPNRITEEDFEGWVQERGLYFWSEWDPRYTPLIASQDPGEEPREGGMLIANVGEGLYVYTAYAWFRQLPAGVPGAYRLFANLVSLPRTRGPVPAGE